MCVGQGTHGEVREKYGRGNAIVIPIGKIGYDRVMSKSIRAVGEWTGRSDLSRPISGSDFKLLR